MGWAVNARPQNSSCLFAGLPGFVLGVQESSSTTSDVFVCMALDREPWGVSFAAVTSRSLAGYSNSTAW